MRTIKKYGNRRLYDTGAKSYINLEQLAALIRDGEVIEVIDAKTGADLSRSVLLQVILEAQGAIDMLPTGLLHRIIRATIDTPHQQMALKQMSMALELLERQLTTMEKQFSFSGMAGTPGMNPSATPAPENEASPAFANEEDLDPEINDAPQHEPDEELEELRQRLHKLEERLKATRD
jgi:polyhydroxyalkanoate synthesis repressor PhaR